MVLPKADFAVWVAGIATAALLASANPAFAHGDLHGQIEQTTANLALELALPPGPRGSEEEHERHHERAKLYFERAELYRLHRDWTKAATDYEAAASHDPGLASVALGRAQMLFEAGNPAAARPVLERFLRGNIDHPGALLLQAQVLMAMGDGVRAVRFLDRALARHPQPEPDHYLARADVLAKLGRRHYPRAIAGLDEGVERLGPLVALDERAITLELALGRSSAALARIDRQARLSGRKDVWLARRADVLEKAGDRAGARAAHNGALDALTALPPHLQSRSSTRQLRQHLISALTP